MTALTNSFLSFGSQGILFRSVLVPVGDTIVMGASGELDQGKPVCSLGVEFFSDAEGTTPAVATAGSIAIEVRTIVNPQHPDALDAGNTIDCTAPDTKHFFGAPDKVTLTPSGVAGPLFWRANLAMTTGGL